MKNNSLQPKSPEIVIKIYPAVKFAASRIPKAMGLDILLAISMIIKRGDKTRGGHKRAQEGDNL